MENKVTFETQVYVCISDMFKTRKPYVGFEVLLVVVMKCSVFWDIAPVLRPASPFFEFFKCY
jgi:hypothetical protein